MQKRRREKRPPRGGFIPKVDKEQEYQTDLYCAICELSFYTPAEKALHDRSRDHAREYQFLRNAGRLDEQGNPKPLQISEEDFRKQFATVRTPEQVEKQLQNASIMFPQEEVNRWPKAFKEWVKRSLDDAVRVSRMESNSKILAAVRAEIRVVLDHHTKHCTLRKESWVQKPLATGALYTKDSGIQHNVLLVHEDQLVKPQPGQAGQEQSQADQPPEAQLDDAQTKMETDTLTEKQSNEPRGDARQRTRHQSHSTARHSSHSMKTVTQWSSRDTSHNLASHMSHRLRDSNVHYQHRTEQSRGSEAPSPVPSSQVPLNARNPQVPYLPYDRYAVPSYQHDPHTLHLSRVPSPPEVMYKELQQNWRMSGEAEILFHASKVADKQLFLAKCGERLGQLQIWDSGTSSSQDRIDVEEVLQRVETLKKQFTSREYEYHKLCSELSAVIKILTERGTRVGTIQECIRIQMYAAIQMGSFGDFAKYSSHFMKVGRRASQWSGANLEFVGHWLLSLLFSYKEDRIYPRQREPERALLHIAEEMRNYPFKHGLMNDLCVFESAQVFKSVLSNNWAFFFHRLQNSIVHYATEGRFKQVMEGFIPFVRERALVTMFRKSCWSDTAVFAEPNVVALATVINFLGWNERDADQSVSFLEATKFITSLPYKFVILGGNAHDWRSAYIRADDDEVKLQDNPDVAVVALTAWSGHECAADLT